LGGYKKILDNLDVDARIISSLQQLIKLHRNPTIHPEVHVSNEEVLATLGMVESVIRVIGIDMNRRSETPEVSLDEYLPLQDGNDDEAKEDKARNKLPSSTGQDSQVAQGAPSGRAPRRGNREVRQTAETTI
jgi:hypothetical protein